MSVIAFEAINMKTMIQAAAVTLLAASAAHAQQAVQWRVQDGGNGHWYQWKVQPSGISWTVAREVCIGRGGHLATPTVPGENQFIFNLTLPTSAWRNRFGPWLGGYQEFSASDYSEPAGGWRWVTGEQWAWTAWWRGEPTNFYCVSPGEDKLHFIDYEPKWNDITNEAGDCEGANWSFLIEWSADCNNDGIVDYGQILQGQLADANADGIPDICQAPTCVDADLFRDFNVDGADLGILLAQWGPSTPLTVSDIDGDGVVNGADLGILLSFWGTCP